jgi:hypothetical protein
LDPHIGARSNLDHEVANPQAVNRALTTFLPSECATASPPPFGTMVRPTTKTEQSGLLSGKRADTVPKERIEEVKKVLKPLYDVLSTTLTVLTNLHRLSLTDNMPPSVLDRDTAIAVAANGVASALTIIDVRYTQALLEARAANAAHRELIHR